MAVTRFEPPASRTVGDGRSPSRPDGRRRRRRTDGWAPWAFIAPTVLGIGTFYLWPTLQSLYFSFTEWGVFGGTRWIGLANYVRLLGDPQVLKALGNTTLYTVVVLASIPIAIAVASMLNRPGLRCRSLFRAMYFLPVVTVPAAVAMVWKLLFNGEFGYINYLLSLVGITGPYWLQTPVVTIVAVAVVGIWTSLGLNIIILGAGLQAIPDDVYEAAELDGAGPVRTLLQITVPLLTPSIFFVTIMTVIAALKVFDLVFLMIGPSSPVIDDTATLVYLFYDAGFISNDKGYAAAIGMVVLVVIAIVTFVQFQLQRRWVHYG